MFNSDSELCFAERNLNNLMLLIGFELSSVFIERFTVVELYGNFCRWKMCKF